MLKKILAVALTSLLLLSATACGSGSSDGSTTAADTVTLEVFNIKVETKDQLENLIATFEESHPNIKINLTTVGGGQDSNAALQAKFASGAEPDIFQINGLADLDKWGDYLLDLKDTELANLILLGIGDPVTKDGSIYGYPMNVEGFSFLVNKEIFENAGVNLDEIASFDDWQQAVEQVDAKKDELGLKAVFGFSAKEFWVVSQYSAHFISPEFNDSVQEIYEAKTIEFIYGPQFQAYTDLINKYNVQPILSLDYSTSVEEYFANNQVAVVHQGNWIVPTLNSLDPDFATRKLDIVPMFVEESRDGTIAVGAPFYWSINKQTDETKIEASKEFLSWMYTDPVAMKSIVDDFQYIPAYSNYDEADITDPVSKKIFGYMTDGHTVPWAHNSAPDGWAQTQFYPEFQKYLDGAITWDSLIQTAEADWKKDRE